MRDPPLTVRPEEGRVEAVEEEPLDELAAASFVRVPKGSLHTLRNAGDSVGRLLTLVVPAGLDRYFEEAGEPGTDVSSPPGPPDVGSLLKTAKRYGIEIPPPPER